jgi:hypothetical protein
MSLKKPQPEASPKPIAKPAPKVSAEGVRRQRQHIKDLTGEDPLRGGVAD